MPTYDIGTVHIANVTYRWYHRLFCIFPKSRRVMKLLTKIGMRECKVCANYKNMGCPNSSLCMCTEDKPYFKLKDLYEV